MRGQGRIVGGILIIFLGVVILASQFLKVDFCPFFFAVLLILFGVALLLRPRMLGADAGLRARLLGPIRHSGAWQVQEEEIWLFVGDVRLDFSKAEIPLGETPIRVFGFVADLRAIVPEDVGVAVTSNAIISNARIYGRKHDSFVVPAHGTSENYETAERKVQLEVTGFIANVRVKAA
jgi:predicted membrane protein